MRRHWTSPCREILPTVDTRALPKLSFSTLACPEWSADVIVERCAALGYDGIEWRGGADGHVSTEWSSERRRELRASTQRAGVRSLSVTSYAVFTSAVASVRDANVEHLRQHVELAADIGAPFVRTFLGSREDDASIDELVNRVTEPLAALAPVAASRNVTIVVEQHDDFVHGERVRAVLEAVNHPAVGAVWDVGNAWAEGEAPETTFRELAAWIRYVQIKDGLGRGDAWQLTSLGAGEIPIVDVLARAGTLPICVEWERAWHPELAPASEALPESAAFVRAALLRIRTSGAG
jgi:sugar phosphate isomerase/epimerase